MRGLLLRLRRERRGMAIVEFAFVAPILILLTMGLSELCYQGYVQSVLTGALQKAGRDSTIQGAGAQRTVINEKVMGMVRTVAKSATMVSTRKSAANFTALNGEPFEDTSPVSQYANNRYDAAKECFTDTNGNGAWDADPSTEGQGGAGDVVVYSMTVTYPRLFPMSGLLGWSDTQAITAKTVLKNQPYAAQVATKRICPKP